MPVVGIGFAIALVVLAAALAAGWLSPSRASWAGAVGACVASAALSVAWASGAPLEVDLPWLPGLGSRFVLALDPLAAPLTVFVTGLAVPILAYSAAYIPAHLREHRAPPGEHARFNALMLIFMATMTVLVVAHDLIVIFAALELSALVSFLLIGFDKKSRRARRAASVALIVTVGSSLAFLLGALVLAADTGTTVLSDLEQRVASGPRTTIALALMAAGVLGKSAQVPLHFWLPRAMAAPTPVSAYLHSATLVASGVFVLIRISALLAEAPAVLFGLQLAGYASIALGGLLALAADDLKRILAYSTIAQYGEAVVLIAIAGSDGAASAAFFIVAHGLCKCALFMTAGAATSELGVSKLSEGGGLLRRAPLLAAASGVSAAGLVGLPATIGHVRDHLFLAAGSDQSTLHLGLALGAAALTAAYVSRFWFGLFGGLGSRSAGPSPSLGHSLPIAFLAVFVVAGGLWHTPLREVFSAAGAALGDDGRAHLGYHMFGSDTWLEIGAWSVGGAAVTLGARVAAPLRSVRVRLERELGTVSIGDRFSRATEKLSDALYRRELRDVRDRISAVMWPAAALVVLGLWGQGVPGLEIGALATHELPLALGMVAASAAAFATVRTKSHLALVLLLSFVGFALALVFALSMAPDVALVVVLIETLLTLLFLALLWRLSPERLAAAQVQVGHRWARWTGAAAGAVAFLVAWISMSDARPADLPLSLVQSTERAHAKDVVTAVLADFRGLDTMGELTVLSVAILGAAAISWKDHR